MKTKELYKSLEEVLAKFEEAHDFPATEPMRDSFIQRFKYTFELSWKLMSSILADEGMRTTGVRNIIRAAANLELHTEPENWFKYGEARNLSSHIYKEEVAKRVYNTAKDGFAAQVKNLLVTCKKYS